MGRKGGQLYINPKKLGGLQKPCLRETMAFLNCITLNYNSVEKCDRKKKLLSECMGAQAGRSKNSWGSINHHLQKLSKGGR